MSHRGRASIMHRIESRFRFLAVRNRGPYPLHADHTILHDSLQVSCRLQILELKERGVTFARTLTALTQMHRQTLEPCCEATGPATGRPCCASGNAWKCSAPQDSPHPYAEHPSHHSGQSLLWTKSVNAALLLSLSASHNWAPEPRPRSAQDLETEIFLHLLQQHKNAIAGLAEDAEAAEAKATASSSDGMAPVRWATHSALTLSHCFA